MSRASIKKSPVKRAEVHAAPRDASVVKIPKAAEIVAAHIRKMILRGELREGENLAPESEMSERFGISRPTLREAFRILESEHFIQVSRGSRLGASIQKPRADSVARYAAFTLQAEGATLAEVYDARLAIEPYVARQLALKKDQKIVKRLREEIGRAFKISTEQNPPEFRITVARLHLTLVQLLGNGALTLFLTLIEQIIERHQLRFRGANPNLTLTEAVRFNHMGLRSFEKLVDLIEAGNGAGAEAHWRTHIENANKHWLHGFDRTAIVDILD